MLADEVVERTFSEILEKGGKNRRDWDILGADISDLVTLDMAVQGRVRDLPNDTIYEIAYEVMLGQENDGVNVTLNERGLGESTPATHTNGEKVYVNPDWWRITVLNALKSVIGQLYPWGVYRRVLDTSLTIPADGRAQDLPAEALELVDLVVEDRPGTSASFATLQRGYDYNVLHQFSPVVVQVYSGIPGRPVYAVYKADYDLSTWSATGQTNLTTLGVPTTLQEHLPLAVAGHLLRGAEVSRLQIEELKRMISAVGGQVAIGANFNVGQGFIDAFKQGPVENEKRKLREQDIPGVVYMGGV